MTKVNTFKAAGATLDSHPGVSGYKKGTAQVVNLVKAFQDRGVTFSAMDGLTAGQNEK
ncbi:MAG: hypothetical protein K2L95_03695 [Alphaproteobacteria bacterium]|nr:hypothetical protein [Alphaproteobacteria bacterium]MDE6571289.1 hypothetical protein [Alphaproteobacteria bacterium]